jgi:hypothetical protein
VEGKTGPKNTGLDAHFDASGWLLTSAVEALRIENLETRLALRRFVCASLELELEFVENDWKRNDLGSRWTAALRGCSTIELALETLKREQELGHGRH